MNYWFLYDTATGQITESYLGEEEKWTNNPAGIGALGPFKGGHLKAKDAFAFPGCYTVVNQELVPVPNIDVIKSERKAEIERQSQLPTLEEQVKQMQEVINDLMMGGL